MILFFYVQQQRKIYFEAGAGEGIALSSPLPSAPASSSSEQLLLPRLLPCYPVMDRLAL
jgi:hypothetical protein